MEILVFLGSTKSSNASTSSIWADDGTGKTVCIAAINQKTFIFILYCLRFYDYSTKNERKLCNQLAPVKELFDKFVIDACVENYNYTIDESL